MDLSINKELKNDITIAHKKYRVLHFQAMNMNHLRYFFKHLPIQITASADIHECLKIISKDFDLVITGLRGSSSQDFDKSYEINANHVVDKCRQFGVPVIIYTAAEWKQIKEILPNHLGPIINEKSDYIHPYVRLEVCIREILKIPLE